MHGWKEIAAFTGKSVRSLQRWERELGFPVRRLGEEREIVIALRSEVAAWLRRASAAHATPVSAGAAPDSPAPPPAPRGRAASPARWWLAGLAAVALAVLPASWAVFTWATGHVPAQPTSWRVSDRGLSVFDQEGRLMWTHADGGSLDLPFYDPARWRGSAGGALEPVRFVDLDGDGGVDVLFVEARLDTQDRRLLAFEAGGSVRFAHQPGTVGFGAKQYAGPWVATSVHTSRGRDGRTTIWPVFVNRPWFPSVVRELLPDGRVRAEYWSNGHITSLTITRWGGRDVLIVGGSSNDTGGGAVAIVARHGLGGSAPALDAPYRCTTCGPSHPEVFLAFPRACLTGDVGRHPYVSEAWFDQRGRLIVGLQHGPAKGPNGAIVYTVDLERSEASAELVPGFGEAHRTLELQGRLDHPFGPRDGAQALPVRVWDGTRLEPIASGPVTMPR